MKASKRFVVHREKHRYHLLQESKRTPTKRNEERLLFPRRDTKESLKPLLCPMHIFRSIPSARVVVARLAQRVGSTSPLLNLATSTVPGLGVQHLVLCRAHDSMVVVCGLGRH